MTEAKASQAINPVVLAVLRGRLEQIADEMDATLFRSAFNPIIAEAHDASHGLYDAQTGDTLVQGKEGLPVFVGVMAFAVKYVIEKTATMPPDEGDVYIFNDPYEGGTHLSDFKLVRPVFREGKIFCWLASVGHWHDVGGNVPGNYNPVATESFAEGVHIPPVKLFRKGVLQSDIVDILKTNSRLPLSVYGDLNAQISALELGQKRLFDLLDEYGDDTVKSVFAELRARAHLQMEAHIGQLSDGTVSASDWLDNDGIVDQPLVVAVDIHVRGKKMVLDFSRSAEAVAGPVNISRSTAIAACYVALKHLFPDVPANAGVLDPIDIVIPEGSLLSATAPRPVGGYTETILRMIDVVFSAMAEVAPERSNGCAYGTINALSLAGYRRDGRRWVMFSFFGGGHGGHSRSGLDRGRAFRLDGKAHHRHGSRAGHRGTVQRHARRRGRHRLGRAGRSAAGRALLRLCPHDGALRDSFLRATGGGLVEFRHLDGARLSRCRYPCHRCLAGYRGHAPPACQCHARQGRSARRLHRPAQRRGWRATGQLGLANRALPR